jgi:hypothetical protein
VAKEARQEATEANSPDDHTRWRRVAEEWEDLATMVERHQSIDGKKVIPD